MCYDHMAGRLGVSLCDMMRHRDYVVLADGGGEITGVGRAASSVGLSVDLARARGAKRHYCRGCIDWTERRYHLRRDRRGARADLPRSALGVTGARQPRARRDRGGQEEAGRARHQGLRGPRPLAAG